MTRTPKLSSGKRLLFYTAALFLTLTVAFAAAEILIRITKPHQDLWELTGRKPGPHPQAHWALIDAFAAYRARPGTYQLEGELYPDGEAVKTVNSHGFISSPEIPHIKPAATIRIAFLGGSSTAGTGWLLSDEDTWPATTVDRLQERNPDRRFDYINGALSGYTSFESFGRLWSRIRFFSPDIVVVYHGWNEMYYFDDATKAAQWRTLPDGSWTMDRVAEPVETYAPSPLDGLLRWSQLLTLTRTRLAGHRSGEVGPGQRAIRHEVDPAAPDVWRTNLRLIREACEVLGIELFVAKQATLATSTELPDSIRAGVRHWRHGLHYSTYVDAFAAINEVIDDEIEAARIIDVRELSGRVDLFFDPIHPTPEGARAIADIVAEALTGHVEESKPAN